MARRRRGGGAATADGASKGGRPTGDMRGDGSKAKKPGPAGRAGGISARTRWWAMVALALIVLALAVRFFGVPALRRMGAESGEVQGAGTAATTTTQSTKAQPEPYPPKDQDLGSVFVGDKYEVLQVIPHDPDAFTQGLTFFNGRLYEGTGLNGQSQLRELSPTDGRLIKSHSMDSKYFGEGIAHFHDANGDERIIQITWKERTGFVYDAGTFEVLRDFTYETFSGEGWGITYDAEAAEFIVSDGSQWLFVWDRDTLEEIRRVEVRLPQGQGQVKPLKFLNELEVLANGLVLANVWYQDALVGIDPKNGNVMRVYDFTNLYRKSDRAESADCFNGIAVTDREGELFVTGKLWPNMYRIKLLG